MAVLLGIAAALTAIGCADEHVSRDDVAVALGRAVEAPLYAEAATQLRGLETALADWCGSALAGVERGAEPQSSNGGADGEDSPALPLEAFERARLAWSRAAVVVVGPARVRRSISRVDWRPVDPARVAAELGGSEPITEERARTRFAANQRGLPAVAVLLAESGPAHGAPTRRQCEYLSALAAVAAGEAEAVASEWRELVGGPSSTEPPASVDDLVRGVVFALENLVDRELRAEAGTSRQPGTEPDRNDVLGRIEGIAAIYHGRPTPPFSTEQDEDEVGRDLGLRDLVAPLSPDIDAGVRDSLDTALAAARSAVGRRDDARFEETHQALVELQRRWSTEVVSLLGVTVGFSDNDGDTG